MSDDQFRDALDVFLPSIGYDFYTDECLDRGPLFPHMENEKIPNMCADINCKGMVRLEARERQGQIIDIRVHRRYSQKDEEDWIDIVDLTFCGNYFVVWVPPKGIEYGNGETD